MSAFRIYVVPVVTAIMIVPAGIDRPKADESLRFECVLPKVDEAVAYRTLCESVRLHVATRTGWAPIAKGPQSVGGAIVEVHVLRLSRKAISARLRWKAGDGRTWQEGPVVGASVSDRPMNDDIVNAFAKNLVEATNF